MADACTGGCCARCGRPPGLLGWRCPVRWSPRRQRPGGWLRPGGDWTWHPAQAMATWTDQAGALPDLRGEAVGLSSEVFCFDRLIAVRDSRKQGYSGALIAVTNFRHESAENRSTGPLESLLSRTAVP